MLFHWHSNQVNLSKTLGRNGHIIRKTLHLIRKLLHIGVETIHLVLEMVHAVLEVVHSLVELLLLIFGHYSASILVADGVS